MKKYALLDNWGGAGEKALAIVCNEFPAKISDDMCYHIASIHFGSWHRSSVLPDSFNITFIGPHNKVLAEADDLEELIKQSFVYFL